jgi:hypothetical protein
MLLNNQHATRLYGIPNSNGEGAWTDRLDSDTIEFTSVFCSGKDDKFVEDGCFFDCRDPGGRGFLWGRLLLLPLSAFGLAWVMCRCVGWEGVRALGMRRTKIE